MKKLFMILPLVILFCLTFGCQKDEVKKEQESLTDPIILQDGGDIPILLDGIFSSGEWDDALSFSVDERAKLLIKTKKGHLFIGIKCPDLKIPVADIFISPEESLIYQLHVSAQLGERILSQEPGSENDPPFKGGDTKDWYANEVRWDEGKLTSIMESEEITREEAFPRVVYPYEGFEFQIKQSKFQSKDIWIRINLTQEGARDEPIVIPAKTERKKIDGWIKLVFNR